MKDPRVYLAHILECLIRIESYVASGEDSFFSEAMVQDAVIRNFEVIGEAVKRLPDSYLLAHPDVPWRGLAAFRNVLIHRYDAVELVEVWEIIENELAPLKAAIISILPPLEQLEREINGEFGEPS